MKLSLISLIAVALAAIADSSTAAPAPRPVEHDVSAWEQHLQSAVVAYKSVIKNWEGSDVAHIIGQPDHSKHFATVALSSLQVMKGHTKSMNDGSPYHLSTENRSKFTHEMASDYIKQAQAEAIGTHEEVAKHARTVAHAVAKKLGVDHPLAQVHHEFGKKNDEYAEYHRKNRSAGRTSDLQTLGFATFTTNRNHDTTVMLAAHNG